MSLTLTNVRSVCGQVPLSPTSAYEVLGDQRVRVTAARFTNTSAATAYLCVYLKNDNLQTVFLCPDGLNLEPGCTLELFEPGEEIWLYQHDMILVRVYNDVKVHYVIFFGGPL